MGVTVDVAYKSLNKFNEVLCGDKVELLQTEDSNIMILADGMGSGVKANILATLTSKILGTMFLNGATLEECVETIVETLPVCQVRQVAYCRLCAETVPGHHLRDPSGYSTQPGLRRTVPVPAGR